MAFVRDYAGVSAGNLAEGIHTRILRGDTVMLNRVLFEETVKIETFVLVKFAEKYIVNV